MPKRKYVAEDKAEDDGYADAECPECGAMVTIHFQRGRAARRLRCPVCESIVTVSQFEDEFEQPLIQLQRPDV